MKKILLVFSLILILSACQSREDKAIKLIEKELFSTLYDFDSYSPIETKITEAKLSVFSDTTLYNKALLTLAAYNVLEELSKEADDAKTHMNIWGPPTYYSSSYSDSQYNKYKETYVEKIETMKVSYEVFKKLAAQLKDTLSTIDSTKVVGWEVQHRFRCKTKGGHSTIADYRYVFDKNIKNILIREDVDSEDSKMLRALVINSQNGTFD